jgi:hypothetical protein
MNDLKRIELSKLVLDFTVYPRHKLSEYNVNDLLKALQAGSTLDPIAWDKNTKIIIDGFHRVTALKRFYGEDQEIVVSGFEFNCKSKGEILLESTKLNAKHGLKLSEWDKARCISLAKEYKVSEELMREALAIPESRIEKLKERIVEVRNKSGKRIRYTQLKRGQEKLAEKKDGKYVTENEAEKIDGDGTTGVAVAARIKTILSDLQLELVEKSDSNIALLEALKKEIESFLRRC